MALLEATVQEVSGEPFDGFMHKHFSKLLGMTQCSFATRPIAKSYDQEIEVFSMRGMPAANLLSNVVDLGQFLKMQFADGMAGQHQVLIPASTREFVRIQNKDFPLTFGQYVGLGWMMSGIDASGGGSVASHGGSLPDSHSTMAILPDHKLGMIELPDSSTSHVAVSKIVTEALRLILEAKTGIYQESAPASSAGERAPTSAELRQFDGNFDTILGLARISTKTARLTLTPQAICFALSRT